MQSPNEDSTTNSPPPSPKPPPSPSHKPQPQTQTQTVASNTNTENAPTARNKGKKLPKRTLRIPKHSAKPANGSPSPADAAPLEGLVEVPVREGIALDSAAAVAVETTAGRMNVDEARGRSSKITLHLKRKPAEASTSPERPICRFCLRHFPTRTTLLDHLQMEHPTTQELVHDQTPDHHQGEDSGGEKKSEEEVSSAAAQGNNGFDLNQPMEQVQASAEKNEEEGTSGDETIDGPRKKFRFDLNEFPSHEDEDEIKP